MSTAVYLGACALLGPWYLRFSWVPLSAFATYPYLKRFTPLCHFGVGAALALAPLAGYAAAHPDLRGPGPALWLWPGSRSLWVSGFDIIYATLDEEFDRTHGVHSMVAWLGRRRGARGLGGAARCSRSGSSSGRPRRMWRRSAAVSRPRPRGRCPAAGGAGRRSGVLLCLEQRWADDVNLAFFKVNVWVGFAVLAIVLLGRYVDGSSPTHAGF